MPRPSHLTALVLAVLAAVAGAGCGGGSSETSTGSEQFRPGAPIVIWGPTSLQSVIDDYATAAGLSTQITLAGTDALADQIRSGGDKPDLFAADSTAIPDSLRDDGLVEDPVPFATDTLVVAVPQDSAIKSFDDLAKDGVTIAIGQKGLPGGDYALQAIDGLPAAQSKKVLANLGPTGSNNNGILSQVTDGHADAAFVYKTDVIGAGAKLRSIDVPASVAPQIVYAGAVVADAKNAPGAQHFLDGLLHGKGAEQLRKAGFGPPPA